MMRNLLKGLVSSHISSTSCHVIQISFVIIILVVCDLVHNVSCDTPPIIEEGIKGVMSAFGDFNSDKLTDVFMIGNDRKSFNILKGYKNEPLLRVNKKWSCSLPKNSPERIVGLMPSDFHGMAMMDVLVITTSADASPEYKLYLVRGDKEELECSSLNEPLEFRLKSQPLLMDFNGDMITDIMGQNSTGRYVWTFGLNATITGVTTFGSKQISDPNSNAFVDMNNDTIPDVFISGEEEMEYWYVKPDGFVKDPIYIRNPLKVKIRGQSSFIDVDSNGTIEQLLAVCVDSACSSSMIIGLKDYSFEEMTTRFPDANNISLRFVPERRVGGLTFPLTLRHADIDGDGYTDFISIMRTPDNEEKVIILKNSHDDNNFWNRTFVPQTFDARIPDGHKPIVAAFFDLYEDGRPDVLIASVKQNEDPESWALTAVINTQMVDACFLKVMVASGLCYADCSAVVGPNTTPSFEPGAHDSVAYGTNQPGPHICHELHDPEGYLKRGCQGQLTQASSFALQMPYTIFGLGSLPNFVDTLSATIPSANSSVKRQRSWTQIVPDAQVVLIPYPKDVPTQWRSKLFLTPSDIVLSTLITLASICIILIVVIAFLHRKEILEDIAEHEEYKRHWPDSR